MTIWQAITWTQPKEYLSTIFEEIAIKLMIKLQWFMTINYKSIKQCEQYKKTIAWKIYINNILQNKYKNTRQ